VGERALPRKFVAKAFAGDRVNPTKTLCLLHTLGCPIDLQYGQESENVLLLFITSNFGDCEKWRSIRVS
jgi:hypothetical protein